MSVSADSLPLVAILTPVYNGAEYLRDCIESVLRQTYRNWVYFIVNNCSTDSTLRIAEEYAASDARIRVSTNAAFVSMPQNFNNAFRLVPPESRYFKPVCADDWLLPECVQRMVEFGIANPSAGVICCYQQSGRSVRWRELPPAVNLLGGREACRTALLERMQLFGAPTAFLYRTDLLASGAPFFPNDRPHSDTSACYECLSSCDYGVVHEVLAVERVHDRQISADLDDMAAGTLAYLEVLFEYGPRYLTPEELEARRRVVVDQYYRYLGGAVWKLQSARFWRFQRARAREIGLDFRASRVARGAALEALHEARHPVSALRKVGGVLASRLRS
jgi:glycosyltransferase involved in cell wall biosynthesis